MKANRKQKYYIPKVDVVEVKRRDIAGFGLGTMAGALCASIFGSTLFKFYTDPNWMGINASTYAFFMLVFTIWNAINDPISGAIVDRTNTRIGRFTPYIRFLGPLLGISFIFMLNPIEGISSTPFFEFNFLTIKGIQVSPLSLYLLVVLLLFDTFYTIVIVAKSGMLNRLSLDHRKRSKVQYAAIALSLVGVATGVVIPNALVAFPSERNKILFSIVITIIGIVVVGSFVFMSYSIREIDKPAEFGRSNLPFFKTVWSIIGFSFKEGKFRFNSPGFICYMVYDVGHVLTYHIFTSNLPNYIDFAFRDNPIEMYIFIGSLVGGAIVGVAILLLINKNSSIRNSLLFATTNYVVGGLTLWLGGQTFVRYIGAFIIAMGIPGPFIYLDPFMSDIIDDDYYRTGTNKAGNYIGLTALFSKPSHWAADVIALAILVPATYQLPPEIRDYNALASASGMVIGLIPAICMFVGWFAIYFFPIVGERYNRMKKALELKLKAIAKKKNENSKL
ncbi:MAG: MFS transporter [Candidatus Lokiarchaeota archaeon]|nr:MFS transporter [Candidatus Lokiarchaeota archaeon]